MRPPREVYDILAQRAGVAYSILNIGPLYLKQFQIRARQSGLVDIIGSLPSERFWTYFMRWIERNNYKMLLERL